MPPLGINQSHDINASFRLDEPIAPQFAQYAASSEHPQTMLWTKRSTMFSKDRDFQDLLEPPQAKQVVPTLRVREGPSNGASEEPAKKLVVGVEATPSVRH